MSSIWGICKVSSKYGILRCIMRCRNLSTNRFKLAELNTKGLSWKFGANSCFGIGGFQLRKLFQVHLEKSDNLVLFKVTYFQRSTIRFF